MTARLSSFFGRQFTAAALPHFTPNRPVFNRWIIPVTLGLMTAQSLQNRTITHAITQSEQNNTSTGSLEEKYAAENFSEVDVNASVQFLKFHVPNEGHVLGILPHLTKAESGVLITTGTERSFFELALFASQNPEKCKGLIIRDFDPQVIAYGHIVTMLLRISKDEKDFEELSGPVRARGKVIPRLSRKEIQKKIEILKKRLEQNTDMPGQAKAFYLKNLEKFAPIYFSTPNTWRLCAGTKDPATQKYWQKQERLGKFDQGQYRPTSFEGVQYQRDPKLFQIVQNFAKKGNIICTVGDFAKLGRLADEKIGVIDFSNVPDYFPMTPPCKEKCLEVWNEPETPYVTTHYLSHLFDPATDKLSESKMKEFDRLVLRFNRAQVSHKEHLFRTLFQRRVRLNPRPFGYSPENLEILQNYQKQWMVDLPHIGWTSFGPNAYRISGGKTLDQSRTAKRLEAKLSVSQIEEIAQHPEIKKFAPIIATYWPYLSKEKYLAFSKMPGSQEAFAKEALKQQNNPEFRKKFDK